MLAGSSATLSFSQEDSDNWRAADGSGDQPDFSAGGGALLFGYRFGIATQCNGAGTCVLASTSLGVDNFRVDVTAAVPVDNNVPEPAVPALLASAVLALAWQRRRRA